MAVPKSLVEALRWLSDAGGSAKDVPQHLNRPLYDCTLCVPPLVSLYMATFSITEWGRDALAEPPDEPTADALAEPQPDEQQRGTSTRRSASVDQQMAAALQRDPTLLSLSAQKWADKYGCTAGNVKQTKTWTETIRSARAMQKADRLQRGK